MSRNAPIEAGAQADEESRALPGPPLADNLQELPPQHLGVPESVLQDSTREQYTARENEDEISNTNKQGIKNDPEQKSVDEQHEQSNDTSSHMSQAPPTTVSSSLPSQDSQPTEGMRQSEGETKKNSHLLSRDKGLTNGNSYLSTHPDDRRSKNPYIRKSNDQTLEGSSRGIIDEGMEGIYDTRDPDFDEQVALTSQKTISHNASSLTNAVNRSRNLDSGLLPEGSAQAAQRGIASGSLISTESQPSMTGSRGGTKVKEKSPESENARSPGFSLLGANNTRMYSSPAELQHSAREESNNTPSNPDSLATVNTTGSISHNQGMSSMGRNSVNSDIMLPRWQPDSEVDECPICHRFFSFFLRKHHCRKCGRVVCNACSPHRITIPYQYIVQPPTWVDDFASEHTRTRSRTISQNSTHDPDIGGGMRVRLCNPCVPDPNTSPPTPNLTLDRPLPPLPPSNSPPPQPRARTSSTRVHVQRSELCFICGDRLPPSNTAVENHIERCIARHLSNVRFEETNLGTPALSGSRLPSTSGQQPPSSSSLPTTSHASHRANRPRHISEAPTLGNIQDTERNTSVGQAVAVSEAPPSRPFLSSRMICFAASHLDTVGEDSECIICMEDFEQGVEMARLECLCKYHKKCIDGWFFQHPGRCPVHGQDNY